MPHSHVSGYPGSGSCGGTYPYSLPRHAKRGAGPEALLELGFLVSSGGNGRLELCHGRREHVVCVAC